MARTIVQEAEVDALLESGRLAVNGKADWKKTMHPWTRTEIPVEIQGDDPILANLKIVVSIPLTENDKRNYVLLWSNVPVRELHINGSHRNKHVNNEVWDNRTHKHKWTDDYLREFAYTPTDITAHEMQGELEQFCAECGIKGKVKLPPLPQLQGGLFDDL